MGCILGERGGLFTTSIAVPSAAPLPELAIVVPNEVRRPMAVRCGLPQLLGSPSAGATTSHIEMGDFPRTVYHKEEREDGTEEPGIALQEVARPDATPVVADEGEPGLTKSARRQSLPHVRLDPAFADANGQL